MLSSPASSPNSGSLGWDSRRIFERCAETTGAIDTPIGRMPAAGALDISGLELPDSDLDELLRVDDAGWHEELPLIEEHFAKFGDRLPQALRDQLAALRERLQRTAVTVG